MFGLIPVKYDATCPSRQARGVQRCGKLTRNRNPVGSPSATRRRMTGRDCCMMTDVSRSSVLASSAIVSIAPALVMVPSRRTHRAKISAPMICPVLASNSGWKNGTTSPASMARRNERSSAARRCISIRISEVKISTRSRPASFARCNATLANPMSSLAVSLASGPIATPILTEIRTSRPLSSRGSLMT